MLGAPSFEVNVTSFGMPEMRCQLEGEYGFLGLPLSQLEGENVADKIWNLSQKSKEQMELMCGQVGACCMLSAGQAVAIPPGWVVVSYNVRDGTSFVRWNFLEKSDVAVVANTISELHQTHHYLKDTDYGALHKVIQGQAPS